MFQILQPLFHHLKHLYDVSVEHSDPKIEIKLDEEDFESSQTETEIAGSVDEVQQP